MKSPLKVLVIGGSGALGSEICRVLSQNQFSVAFTYHHHKTQALSLQQELAHSNPDISAFPLDLEDLAQIQPVISAACEQLQGLDALIVASGLASGHFHEQQPFIPKLSELTPAGYERMMTVNVRGPVFACQAALPYLRKSINGRIIIIGSIDGVKPVPAPVDYACCKSALCGLTRALSKELGKYNILVNMIAPGILEGGMASLLTKELLQEYLKYCTLKRVGRFSEVAKMAAFLAGPKNTYLTGQIVVLDGGL